MKNEDKIHFGPVISVITQLVRWVGFGQTYSQLQSSPNSSVPSLDLIAPTRVASRCLSFIFGGQRSQSPPLGLRREQIWFKYSQCAMRNAKKKKRQPDATKPGSSLLSMEKESHLCPIECYKREARVKWPGSEGCCNLPARKTRLFPQNVRKVSKSSGLAWDLDVGK